MNPEPRAQLTKWRKSSYSESNNNSCVEVGHATDVVAFRDSKAPKVGLLTFPSSTWVTLVRRLGEDRFS
ncbi:MAG TPA: DUF397 domain-containing protein [Pseudonocardiaceae bacterium]